MTLESLFVPWLDVNQKVGYTLISTGETAQYVIQEISVNPISGTMTLTMVRFRPLYPWLGVDDDWLTIVDDGNGNVTMDSKYAEAFFIVGDGNGNVDTTFYLPISITDDGNGDVTLIPSGYK